MNTKKEQTPLQKLSQVQTSRITVIQNQRYSHKRMSGTLGLLKNNAAKLSEI